MKFHADTVSLRDDIQPKVDERKANSRRQMILKLSAMSIPAAVMISATFFPLRELIRQALIGIILIWLYLGAMIGFSFME